ncbi:methionine ABC transporter ATP-binding protein [Pendulispora albinea]|uniref:ATP-binding cassette domain-containing protein n=1 Tax=Pendulispora albinea TaxID=2741071 RepID=A0ABZ2M3J0_9BACT
MIRFQNVRKVYGTGEQALAALDDVTLHVPEGEIFGVLGQSGAGKSTLIRCVNLLERPTSGSVVVNGQEMTSLSPPELRKARQQIGIIFQHFNLLRSRTVAENIAFPLEVVGQPKAQRDTRVKELLSLVGLSDKINAYPSQLSGGQKQRVGIARALACEPKVLLSDEATSALDPQTTRSILDLLRDLNRRLKLTVLLITHEMTVVKHICDRVAVLRAGRVVEQGLVDELIVRPGSEIASEFFPRIVPPSGRNGAVLATITFAGASADEPILSSILRTYDVGINILGGGIETVREKRVGRLLLELSGPDANAARSHLERMGLLAEGAT